MQCASDQRYTVERRGGQYVLYRPDGRPVPGQRAYISDREGINKLYKMAAELNKKLTIDN